jgi:hypothetical protein
MRQDEDEAIREIVEERLAAHVAAADHSVVELKPTQWKERRRKE